MLTAQSSARRTPTPLPPTPRGPALSAEDRAQARKVLAAAVDRRRAAQPKLAVAAAAGFRAHRCAVLYDPNISGREREANGPFRIMCSDWVRRRSQPLAIKDAEQPCAIAQYGSSLAGCTSWVDRWNSGAGKWVSVWRQSS